MNVKQINRWNVILGNREGGSCGCSGGDGAESLKKLNDVLDYIYGASDVKRGGLAGGQGASVYTVPEWINAAKQVFPPHGFEVITGHAIEKFDMAELLADDAVLENITPDINVLCKVLTFKSVLTPENMCKVKNLVRRVAEELSERMKNEISPALFSHTKSFNRCYHGNLQNLDVAATIRKNLKTYNAQTKRIYPNRIIFRENSEKTTKKRIILLVDQSGSMANSVINSALLASILAKTSFLDVRMVVFDTQVVDLTEQCNDITELLFAVQLGGGTDIGLALSYGEKLIKEPRDTMVILISDLADGGGYKKMYAAASSIINSGAKFLVLTAMDYNGCASYDEAAADKLVRLGAKVASKTPKELCEWIVANK